LAFTGGSTKQLQTIQAGIASGNIDRADTEGFGVSMDSPAANAAFAKQIRVTFPLLSDMNHKMMAAYGIHRWVPTRLAIGAGMGFSNLGLQGK
jgi:peroxiredoxin